MLDETVAAIRALTTGGAKSVEINGRKWTSLDLQELWSQHDRLKSLAAAESSNGGMNCGVVVFGEMD